MENNVSDQSITDSWCLIDHNRPHHSQWLHSTLAELEKKVKMIVELVEEDGDTFAQRAEMYYNRRPQLIRLVRDLQKSYISLANKSSPLHHDQDHGPRVSSPHPSEICTVPEMVVKSKELMIRNEGSDHEIMMSNCKISGGSETGCPDSKSTIDYSSDQREKMWNNLRVSVSELIEDNLKQQAELIKRNNDKRESIKQLRLHINQLQNENRRLKDSLAKCLDDSNNHITFDHVNRNRSHASKLKGLLVFGKKL